MFSLVVGGFYTAKLMVSKKERPRIEDLRKPYPLSFKNRRPLSQTHPQVARTWHYPKNCGFGPEEFSFGSDVEVWWKCQGGKDHIFQMRIADRVKYVARGGGCPFCRGFKPSITNSIATFYPRLVKEWDPDLNEFTPEQLAVGSKRLIWWRCECGHKWKTTVYHRSHGSNCPRCSLGTPCDLREYPKVLREFDRKKNVDLDPYNLPAGTKCWWKCKRSDDHVWYSSFEKREHTLTSRRCPFCRNKRASKTNNLTMDKRLLTEFHPTKNGALTPEQVNLGTHKRIWWRCKRGLDHEWQASVKDRRHYESGCPFCSNHRVSVTNCLANVAPQLVREWHPTWNKPATPKSVVATGRTRYWWRCNNGHNFQANPADRVRRNSGCKACYYERAVKF